MAEAIAPTKSADAAIPTFATLVFFDLETTDLIGPNHLFKMTELSMCAVERGHFLSNIRSTQVPRVLNRLNLCVNPTVPFHPEAAKASKLNLSILEGQKSFDTNIFNAIQSFIGRLKAPICLIAHKGFEFDFPLLKAEINSIGMNLGADLYCADSLPFFQMVYPNQSNTLSNVFNRIFRRNPIVSHAAEADVFTLLLSTMWTPVEFLNHIQEKAMPFDGIVKSW